MIEAIIFYVFLYLLVGLILNLSLAGIIKIVSIRHREPIEIIWSQIVILAPLWPILLVQFFYVVVLGR